VVLLSMEAGLENVGLEAATVICVLILVFKTVL
jgi:hypothetical protein